MGEPEEQGPGRAVRRQPVTCDGAVELLFDALLALDACVELLRELARRLAAARELER